MLKLIFFEFLKLGFIAFGGPAGHIALMHKRFVEELKWIDEIHFLDLISISSVIPGPSSTELTLLIGRFKGGKRGLWVAGLSFIFPALIMVLLLSYLYNTYGNIKLFENIFYYVLPIMVAIIVSVTITLSKKTIYHVKDIGVVFVAFVLSYVLSQVWIFIVLGLLRLIIDKWIVNKHKIKEGISILLLFWIFFQIGATLYGSGYVLVSYLDTFFVKSNLLSLQEVMDAITVGQITPGPVFTTAGFIGFMLTNNISGFLFSAIGIFLPGFLIITWFYPFIEKLRLNQNMSNILKTLQLAAIGLLCKVIVDYSIFISSQYVLILITLVSLILLIKFKMSTTLLIGCGVILSIILNFT